MSRMGSTSPSTWITSASSNAPAPISTRLESRSHSRTIWKMPSTARTCERKAFPSPAPEAAPAVKPAMSMQVRNAGILFVGANVLTSQLKRASGTATRASSGSIVAYGKLATFPKSVARQQLPLRCPASSPHRVQFPWGSPTRRTALGEGVEQTGFADVGHADKAHGERVGRAAEQDLLLGGGSLLGRHLSSGSGGDDGASAEEADGDDREATREGREEQCGV